MAVLRGRSTGRTPSARVIADEVMSWPGVATHDHQFGGVEFRLGKRQLGHLHGNRIANIPLRRSLRDELVAAGRVRVHRWRPDSGWVTVDIGNEEGRNEAVRLLRVGYDGALRARGRRGGVEAAA
jgi:Family of unknown function (DUF5519)